MGFIGVNLTKESIIILTSFAGGAAHFKTMESSWTGLRLEFIPMKIGAGETDLRFGSFSSFRRKPESSNIKDEIRCLHNYGLISNTFGKRYPT